jgi:hypothetical protein
MVRAMFVTLLVPTFIKILKLTFTKHIGLYCSIQLASSLFGNEVITPKFCLKRGILLVCN